MIAAAVSFWQFIASAVTIVFRYKLTSCRSSERNRNQNALTVCNIAFDLVVSGIFGKSATSVIDYLIEQSDNSIRHEETASRLLRSLKKTSDSVIESIEGYQMTDSQKYRMRLVRVHMDYITSTINDIDTILDSLIAPYENAVQLLCTINVSYLRKILPFRQNLPFFYQ